MDLQQLSLQLGEVRGELSGVKSSVNRIERKIDYNQALNTASQDKRDEQLAELKEKVDTNIGVASAKRRVHVVLLTLFSGAAGGLIKPIMDYFSTGGTPPPHP